MIPYILHVTVIITACFLFYKALLQRGTFFRLNRYTLLACVGVSFLLPLIPIPQQWSWRSASSSDILPAIVSAPEASNQPISTGTSSQTSSTPNTSTYKSAGTLNQPSIPNNATNSPAGASLQPSAGASSQGSPANPSTDPSLKAASNPSTSSSQNRAASSSPNQPTGLDRLLPKLFQGLSWLYLFGVIVLGANFLAQIIVLLYQSYRRPVLQDGPFRIVETTGDRAPCSFGHTIFINPSKYDWDTYNQILLHEKIHASDRHTIDILLAETLIVLQWFNPFAWLYRKEVENNLEFLTDQALLRTHEVEKSAYQLSLLKVAAPNQPFGITTNYNQSLLKRRIIMMNSKSSSLHTIWKYFFLLPLLTCLVCALNKPAAFGQSGLGKTTSGTVITGNSDRREGSWFATTKEDKLCFEFKGDKDEHSWSNNNCILKSEFATLPGVGKTEFKLVREAGVLNFYGQFDGQQGYGHYSFKEDAKYVQTLRQKEIEELNDDDLLAFFLLNIKIDYIDMLQHNGYPHVSKNNIIAMTAMHIDLSYIESWKDMGYSPISENDLIAARAMNIDKAYIEDLHSAGYTNLTINQLIAFKAQGIDGRYVKQLSLAQTSGLPPASGAQSSDLNGNGSASSSSSPATSSSPSVMPSPAASSSPAMAAATPKAAVPANAAIPRMPAASPNASVSPRFRIAPAVPSVPVPGTTVAPGLPSPDDLIALKSMNIDSQYVASMRAAGYNDIPMSELISMRSLNVDAAFIKSFQSAGFKDIPVESIIAIKAQGITPEFVNGFRNIGYKDISAEQLPALKSMDITPAYIKGFRDLGYTNISLELLPALKSMNITPAYIKEFSDIGYTNIPLDILPSLKSLNITPAYIKGFRDIGYTHMPLDQLPALKSMDITPEFVKQFRNIGFDNISLDQLTALKSVGVTPSYVTKMKGQGFVSKDLNKYIQLKSSF